MKLSKSEKWGIAVFRRRARFRRVRFLSVIFHLKKSMPINITKTPGETIKQEEILSATDKNFATLYARMSVHEFLLEIVVSEMFLSYPNPEISFNQFSSEFLERLNFGAEIHTTNPNPELLNQIQSEALEIAENFLNKTWERLSDKLKANEKF